MSLISALLAGRRAAERNMTSTVKVYTLGSPVLNESTGQYAPTQVQVYSGPGKIQFFDNAYPQTPEAGAHTFVMGQQTLHLPVSASMPPVGALVAVTADAVSPHLLGRVWRVTNIPAKSHQTALRLPIEEVTA